MKKNYLILALLFLQVVSRGQCPLPVIAGPDSACAGTTINFSNTAGSLNQTANWDFDAGDLQFTPTGTITSIFPELVNSSGFDVGKDNGNFIGINISSSGALSRYEFGTQLNSIPIVTPLASTIPAAFCLTLNRLNGNWFAFVTTLFNDAIYRIDFGNSLMNIPVITNLSLPGGVISWPFIMSVTEDQGNYYGIISNYLNGTITLLDFGNNPANNSPAASVVTVLSNNPTGVSLVKDCDQWYGFVNYSSAATVTRINFSGLPISANATVTTNAFSTNTLIRRQDLIQDNGNWYMFVNNVDGNDVQRIQFGANLNNSNPVFTSFGSIGGLHTSNTTNVIRKFESTYFGITANNTTGGLGIYKFPEVSGSSILTTTNPSANVSFSNTGWHYISLKAIDTLTGNQNMVVDSVFILPGPIAAFTTGSACEGTPVIFQDNSLSVPGFTNSVSWDFGDLSTGIGTSINHLYASTGPFTIVQTVTSTNGCSITKDSLIQVAIKPTAFFTLTDTACSNTQILFLDSSVANEGTITNWEWNFGNSIISNDTSPTYFYNTAGNFNVSLSITASTGCIDSSSTSLEVIASPVAEFSVANTCIGETVSFTNQTNYSGTGQLIYDWDFGNATSSTDTDPQVIYPSVSGSYSVTLVAASVNGCSDSINKTLLIGNKPIPDFTVIQDTVCSGSAIVFTDNTLPASGDSIIARYWNFGDNSYDSISINPTHIYAQPGMYSVTLIAVSPSNCDSSVQKQMYVLESPDAVFSTQDVCFGDSVYLNDNSTSTSSPITNWDWQFGDQSFSTIVSPSHLYQNAGTYLVQLQVTSQAGCTDTISSQVIVHSLPIANFTYPTGCTGTSIQFTDSSNVLNSSISNWQWSFGDNSTPSLLQSPQHTYSQAQLYSVQLIVESVVGCSDTIQKLFVVNPSPIFTTSVISQCDGIATPFNYIPGANQTSQYGYYWNFGDNNFSFLQSPTHLYTGAGDYIISLTVTDLNTTCSTNFVDSAKVYYLPVAQFSTDSICANDTIKFINLSSSVDGGIINYNWNFGSFGTSQNSNPTLFVPTSGTVTTSLTVVTSLGCRDSITKTTQIFPLPLSSFNFTPLFGTPPLLVNFTNTSTSGNYNWNFGDGSLSSTLQNPTHIYLDTGSYSIRLNTLTSKGCMSNTSKVLRVLYPNLDLAIENISYVKVNGTWKIGCRLRNTGNLDIDTFRLGAKLEGKSEISESYTSPTIPANGVIQFDFTSEFTVDPGDSPNFLCINILSVNNVQDDNSNNNSKCTGNTSKFDIVALYPVPAKDEIQLGIAIPDAGIVSIEIYDILGKIVTKITDREYPKGYNQTIIDLRNYSSGSYLLQMLYKNEVVTKKFIRN